MARTRNPLKILAGFGLLVLGLAMLVLPGPGWVVIALGLAVLAKEYAWARWLLARLKKGARAIVPDRWQSRPRPEPPSSS